MTERLVDTAIINLDRRPDRMDYIYKNIPILFSNDNNNDNNNNNDAQHTFQYRRFPAIDGKNLSNYYKSNLEFRELLDTIRGQQRVLGEVGCSLSHYSLWHSHAHSPKSKYLLVFEDDVMFTDKSTLRLTDIIQNIQSLEHSIPNPMQSADNVTKCDVIYLGGQWTPDYDIDSNNSYFKYQGTTSESLGKYYLHSQSHSRILYRRKNRSSAVIHNDRNIWYTPLFRTAGAYLVTQQGARKLLEAVETDTALFMKTPLDMWILEMDFRGYLDVFDGLPHPFYQAGFDLVKEPAHIENDIHRTKYETVCLDDLH
jgi:GR25 family glycosyltransferase involved in LPS biosynthesis